MKSAVMLPPEKPACVGVWAPDGAAEGRLDGRWEAGRRGDTKPDAQAGGAGDAIPLMWFSLSSPACSIIAVGVWYPLMGLCLTAPPDLSAVVGVP